MGWALSAFRKPEHNVIRLVFSREGADVEARWYAQHHALAATLSLKQQGFAVHAYLFMPLEFEEVVTFGSGRRAGGERLEVASLEVDEDAWQTDDAFAEMQENWPLGRLAQVFGLSRAELLDRQTWELREKWVLGPESQ
ncbi:MAG: hypothetical protein ACKVPX_15470 [Myxococcaceae bacterium]